MIKRVEILCWSVNLWLSYFIVAMVLMIFSMKGFLGFSIGAFGAQFVLLMLIEDARKIRVGNVKTLKFGFFKRYALSAMVMAFSALFGVEGLIFSFLGLELVRVTLTTYLGSGEL